jgi:hypothetical protein
MSASTSRDASIAALAASGMPFAGIIGAAVSMTPEIQGMIEADIANLEQLATSLEHDVSTSYAPQVSGVLKNMRVQPRDVPADFQELHSFLMVHNEAQDIAQQNVSQFNRGTLGFAQAAQDIGGRYRDADQLSHARVSYVNGALQDHGVLSDPSGGTNGTANGGTSTSAGRVDQTSDEIDTVIE